MTRFDQRRVSQFELSRAGAHARTHVELSTLATFAMLEMVPGKAQLARKGD